MTNKKSKRAQVRKLATIPGIKTARQLAEEQAQPCLDLDDGHLRIDDVVVTDMEALRKRAAREAKAAKEIGFTHVARWGD
jgi:hypothetical protein